MSDTSGVDLAERGLDEESCVMLDMLLELSIGPSQIVLIYVE